MSGEENKAIFLRFVEALKARKPGIIEEFFSPNFAFHSPRNPDWPRGLEGARKMLTSSSDVVSDFGASIEDIFAEGDKVAVRWTFRATYKGEVGPGSPTLGERFNQAAISIYRFVNGKIEDDWGVEGPPTSQAAWGM
jgi:predicted ester cyclase